MENASKALLMAGGILLGVLILALMVTLFASSKSLSDSYEETKKSEAVQQFNVNFTKYVGQDMTIHEIITMKNFSNESNNKVRTVTVKDNYNKSIQEDLKDVNFKYASYTGKRVKLEIVYRISVTGFDEGYVSSVTVQSRKLKVTEYDQDWNVTNVSYTTV